jgi:hypothetical protein
LAWRITRATISSWSGAISTSNTVAGAAARSPEPSSRNPLQQSRQHSTRRMRSSWVISAPCAPRRAYTCAARRARCAGERSRS